MTTLKYPTTAAPALARWAQPTKKATKTGSPQCRIDPPGVTQRPD